MKTITKVFLILFMVISLTGCAYSRAVPIKNEDLKILAAEIRKMDLVESCENLKISPGGRLCFNVIVKDEFSSNDMKKVYSLAKEYIENNVSLGSDPQLKKLLMNGITIEIKTKERSLLVIYEAKYESSQYYMQNDDFIESLKDTDEPYIGQ